MFDSASNKPLIYKSSRYEMLHSSLIALSSLRKKLKIFRTSKLEMSRLFSIIGKLVSNLGLTLFRVLFPCFQLNEVEEILT